MQIHCKKCGKDVTMETEFEIRSPYRIINNHKCDVKAKEMRGTTCSGEFTVVALERGFE